MKDLLVAYRQDDLSKLEDKSLAESLGLLPHIPLKSYFSHEDPRRDYFPNCFVVPSLLLTETIKLQLQDAFSKAGAPLLFTPVYKTKLTQTIHVSPKTN